MFVYVKLRECGKLMIANDTEIRHFDSKNVNFQKFYKVYHKNEFKDCSIVYCKESKEELQALIASRRASVPPLKRMQSASEISDADTPNKALLDMGDDSERILMKRLKIQSSQNELEKSHEELRETLNNEKNEELCISNISDDVTNGVSNPSEYIKYGTDDKENKNDSERIKTDKRKANKKDINDEITNCVEVREESSMMAELIALKLKVKELRNKKFERDKALQTKQNKIDSLVKKNQELQQMLSETTKLNMDLQRRVINFFEQSEDIESAKNQTQKNLIENVPSVGFLRRTDNMIHVGQGVWLPKGTFDAVIYNAKRSKQIFVKNMALALFGPETLKTSSVEGRSNAKVKNGIAKTPLDPLKLRAITDIFEYHLRSLKCSQTEVDLWLRRIGSIISSKISDLNRPPRTVKKTINILEETEDNQKNDSDDNSGPHDSNLEEDDY